MTLSHLFDVGGTIELSPSLAPTKTVLTDQCAAGGREDRARRGVWSVNETSQLYRLLTHLAPAVATVRRRCRSLHG